MLLRCETSGGTLAVGNGPAHVLGSCGRVEKQRPSWDFYALKRNVVFAQISQHYSGGVNATGEQLFCVLLER